MIPLPKGHNTFSPVHDNTCLVSPYLWSCVIIQKSSKGLCIVLEDVSIVSLSFNHTYTHEHIYSFILLEMTSALQVRCSLKRTGFYLPLKPHVELHSGWARGRDISSCKPLSAREKNLFLFFFFFFLTKREMSFFLKDIYWGPALFCKRWAGKHWKGYGLCYHRLVRVQKCTCNK